jgi:outer membrane protein OmpA-like peptidoglycan-associated protein
VGVIVLIIALLWLFWPKAEQKPVPVKGPVAIQPAAPKPEPEPAPAPKAAEPVTATVLFDYDSSTLRPGETAKLDELAGKAKGRAPDRLDVVGHADRIGSDSYNMGLSRRRAEAVRNYLVEKGVESGRVRAEARGESDAATGTACQNMGPERRGNRKLVECLQRDRRVAIGMVAAR